MKQKEKFKSTVERMSHFDKQTDDRSNGTSDKKKSDSSEVIVGTELIELKRK